MVFLGIALTAGCLVLLLNRSLVAGIVTALVMGVVSYTALPTLAYGHFGLVAVGIYPFLLSACFALLQRDQGGRHGRLVFVYTAFIVLFGLTVPGIISAPVFRSSAYYGVIGKVDTLTNSTDLPLFDPAEVRIVDHEMALRLADKRMGEIPALGSQAVIGEMHLQAVGKERFWVAPLNHRGPLKWLRNSDGTPGYMMVSATNPSDVRLVHEVGGVPIQLRFNGGSILWDDVKRHIYSNGYITKGITDLSFEIDDSGRPYYVATLFTKRVGFQGSDATGVVVLDAQTGELQEYSIEDAPSWIDRIQPEDFVTKQLTHWGEYPHGWWNFSDRDKLRPTEGMTIVYGNDGRNYFYTGIRSFGGDQGTVGFVLVDTRTKATRFFKQAGATETAAMRAAESALPEKRYRAMYPVPGNIAGDWTYVTPLKNAEGQIGAVALVNVADYRIVGIGEDARSAVRDYQRKIASRGGQLAMDAGVRSETLTGRVIRQASDTREGNTDYYLQIEGAEEIAFIGGSSLSVELPLTRLGDSVRVGFDRSGTGIGYMKEFDNLSLDFVRSATQVEVDRAAEAVRAGQQSLSAVQNTEARWESLSDSAKLEVLGDPPSS